MVVGKINSKYWDLTHVKKNFILWRDSIPRPYAYATSDLTTELSHHDVTVTTTATTTTVTTAATTTVTTTATTTATYFTNDNTYTILNGFLVSNSFLYLFK